MSSSRRLESLSYSITRKLKATSKARRLRSDMLSLTWWGSVRTFSSHHYNDNKLDKRIPNSSQNKLTRVSYNLTVFNNALNWNTCISTRGVIILTRLNSPKTEHAFHKVDSQ